MTTGQLTSALSFWRELSWDAEAAQTLASNSSVSLCSLFKGAEREAASDIIDEGREKLRVFFFFKTHMNISRSGGFVFLGSDELDDRCFYFWNRTPDCALCALGSAASAQNLSSGEWKRTSELISI